MRITYKTQNTCSTEISFDFSDNIVTNVEFKNGCNGNLKAISKLVDGLNADQILEKTAGIMCGRKGTSCADQLALAINQAKKIEQKVKQNEKETGEINERDENSRDKKTGVDG